MHICHRGSTHPAGARSESLWCEPSIDRLPPSQLVQSRCEPSIDRLPPSQLVQSRCEPSIGRLPPSQLVLFNQPFFKQALLRRFASKVRIPPTAETVSKLESDASEPAGVNHPSQPER